ncbi:DUF1580 domain-containing protein [Planctomycetaceae bacterium SH139]
MESSTGRRFAVSTFYRWSKYGVRGVRLETCFLGGARYTSDEALSRFFNAVTEQMDGTSEPALNPTTEASRSSQTSFCGIEKELTCEGR